MTYPAELTFKQDATLSHVEHRVYDYLSTVLDFHKVRMVKSQLCAPLAGVDREVFIDALNALVAKGYLVEHARGERNVRRFTLAWSIASSTE